MAYVDELHDAVVQLHPGSRDPESPAFSSRVEIAYRSARARAEVSRKYLDRQAATVGFMLSFRDGHTIYRLNQTPTRVRWPGFLIDSQGGTYVVRRPNGVPRHAARIPKRIRRAYRFFLEMRTEGPEWAKQCRLKTPTGNIDVTLDWQVEQWAAIAPSLGTYNRARARTIAQKTRMRLCYTI